MTDLGPTIDLLAANLGRLTTADGEYFDYVPFLDDSDTARDIKRKLAEGLALLLDNHGHLRQPATETPDKIINLSCGQCSGNLLVVNTSHPISGKQIIEAIAQRDPECRTKHARLTPDVIRQRIQEQAAQEQADSV
jgi:hypothetical protein